MPRWSREISYYQKRVIKRVSIVEDYLNLREEGDLTYDDQGRGASQIELDLLEYCHDQGGKTSDRKIRRGWSCAGDHASGRASSAPQGRVHHSRCLHTGHNNDLLYCMDLVFRPSGQTKGVEIRGSDAADRSNQRATQVERRDLQKRDEQGRDTKVKRFEISLQCSRIVVPRKSCLLLQGRSCVRGIAFNFINVETKTARFWFFLYHDELSQRNTSILFPYPVAFWNSNILDRTIQPIFFVLFLFFKIFENRQTIRKIEEDLSKRIIDWNI